MIILRVCFSIIVGFFGVVSLIAGCIVVSSEEKLFPSGFMAIGPVLMLAAAGCCIAGKEIDVVLAALGVLCFFINGFFDKEEDSEDLGKIDDTVIIWMINHARIIRLIVDLVFVGVFALL